MSQLISEWGQPARERFRSWLHRLVRRLLRESYGSELIQWNADTAVRAERERVTVQFTGVNDRTMQSNNSNVYSVTADRIAPVPTPFQVSTYKLGDVYRRPRREKRYNGAVRIKSKIEEQLFFHPPTCWRLDWCSVNAVESNRGTLTGISNRKTNEHKCNH
jgi:hypothetical protein